ncbi:glutaredoxin family protein [Numidum massiliense]|uniref:glutaredoxin family protein n=1 Tax=Numidum massiliense TaxID=1522315 RepID=UPI0006D5A0D7|nr:glutaredoxin family protein [Numidum massiliense]
MKVIVYSRTHCLECNVLKKFLKDYRIPYENRDCSKHPEYTEEVKRLGFLGVPVTVIGDEAVQGLEPEKILQLLGKGE